MRPPVVSPNTDGTKTLQHKMHSVIVEHPVYDAILKKVEFILSLYDSDGETPPSCLPILGPAGIGKSTVIKELKDRYPRVENARKIIRRDGSIQTCDYVPLLCVKMPNKLSVREIARQMLRELGDPEFEKGTPTQMSERVDIFLAGCGTRGVLFDEGQRIVDRAGALTSEEVIDWLKDRRDNNCAAFFLVGLSRLSEVFRQDSQFERRWDVDLKMRPYDWNCEDSKAPHSRQNFMGLLLALCNESPVSFSAEVDVNDESVAKRFFYAARGNTGLLKESLLETVMKRIMERDFYADTEHQQGSDTQITFELLSEAFSAAFRKDINAQQLIDPFGPDWDDRLPPPLQEDNQATAAAKRRRRKQTRKSERKRKMVAAFSKS